MARILAIGNCRPAAEHLRKEGYEVLQSSGKARSLGLVRDLLPEVVLLEGKGDPAAVTELLRQLGTDPTVSMLPVLLLVTEPDADWVRRGLDAGASEVIAAGTEREELLARVRAALRAKRAYAELIAERQRATLLELAGAVAHRMNQPLTSMSVIVETLRAAQDRGDLSTERLVTRLGELQGLVERMATIVRQVATIVEYRTTEYVGDVRIIDIDSGQEPPRR